MRRAATNSWARGATTTSRIRLAQKWGAFLWNGDYAVDFKYNTNMSDLSGKKDGVSLLLGGGADVGLFSQWRIRAELDFYEGNEYKVDLTTLDGDANVFALTLGVICAL